jgi:hypothetical protein
VMVIWDALSGKHLAFYPDLPIYALAWSPDDTRLVNADGLNTVQISQAQ